MPLDTKSGSILRSRAKSTLTFGTGIAIRIEFAASSGTAAQKTRDRFVQGILQALRQREWERVEERKRVEAERIAKLGEYQPRRIGLSGVTDRINANTKESRTAIETGFASLDGLRKQAEDLVSLANTFRAKERGEGVDELVGMMAEMGIVSPVTKASAGNIGVYREQLSREIAGFLKQRIVEVGGVMTMTDAYCVTIRNRATTELVAPGDFRVACDAFNRLGLGIVVVLLEGGITALAVDVSSDARAVKGVVEWVREHGCASAVDFMRWRNIPIQRAVKVLEASERAGGLVRDETGEGTRFFANRFDEFLGG